MFNFKLLLATLVLVASFQQIVGTETTVSLQNLAKDVEVEEDLSLDFHIFDVLFGEANLKKFAQNSDLADISDSSSALHKALLNILTNSLGDDYQSDFDDFDADENEGIFDIQDDDDDDDDDDDLDLDQVFDHQDDSLDITDGDILDALALLQDLTIADGQASTRHYLTPFILAAINELDKLELPADQKQDEKFEYPFDLDEEIIIMADDETNVKQDNISATYPALTWIIIAVILSALVAVGVKSFKKTEQNEEVLDEEPAAARYYQI